MWYVGSRTARGCHINDGYICSSKYVKPLILENSEDWQRDILLIGESKYIKKAEDLYLQKVDAKNDILSYNRCNNDGHFGRVGEPTPDHVKTKISKALLGKQKGPQSVEHKIKLSESKKGRIAWNKGLKTPEHVKEKQSKTHKANPTGLGRVYTDEMRKQISDSVKRTKQMKKLSMLLQKEEK